MKRMKNRKKTLLLAVTIALVLAASVGGTIAWLTTSTNKIVNQFTPVAVDTEIVETFENNKKSSIAVRNVNDPKNIPVYVRVAVSGNWVLNGEIVEPWTPSLSINSDDWFSKDDGFYYYKHVLPVGGTTSNLLSSSIVPGTTREDGAHLEVDVLHQSIQSTPEDAVEERWPVTVDEQGKLM